MLEERSSSKNDLASPCEQSPDYNFGGVTGRWTALDLVFYMSPSAIRFPDRFDLIPLCRVRLRSDGAAIPRRQSGPEAQSPTRVADTPPRAAACPSSPHKMSISKARVESPEKRRLGTFGSAGSINYPDRKAYPEGHPLRPASGATRHSSLGDHKTLETEALAEV